MRDEPTSLDEDVQMILTYVGIDKTRYHIDDSGRLYIRRKEWNDSKLVTPYNTGEAVKYIGVGNRALLQNALCEQLEKKGVNLTRKKGENIFTRVFNDNPALFFKATHDVCKGPCVTRIPYDELKDHIDGQTSIVATNRKLELGFYTVPIKRYASTNVEISDEISTEIHIPEWIKGNNNRWP
ncbi:hypothetical protein KY349_06105 [Candidatus Woesearchaeota archaeon]|nr:hypothetical protein [Candidatus Woesearchaeota archaeon]